MKPESLLGTRVTLHSKYRRKLIQSCGKAKPNAQAAHNDAKRLHLTRNACPIGEMIQAAFKSANGGMADMLAALRARVSITADLLEIDRICTWVNWTAMQQKGRI